MDYLVTGKEEDAMPEFFGGGVRRRLILTTKRTDGSEDGITSRITVSRTIFELTSVGDTIQITVSVDSRSDPK